MMSPNSSSTGVLKTRLSHAEHALRQVQPRHGLRVKFARQHVIDIRKDVPFRCQAECSYEGQPAELFFIVAAGAVVAAVVLADFQLGLDDAAAWILRAAECLGLQASPPRLLVELEHRPGHQHDLPLLARGTLGADQLQVELRGSRLEPTQIEVVEDLLDGPLTLLSVLVQEQVSRHAEPACVSQLAQRQMADQVHRPRQVTVVLAEVDQQDDRVPATIEEDFAVRLFLPEHDERRAEVDRIQARCRVDVVVIRLGPAHSVNLQRDRRPLIGRQPTVVEQRHQQRTRKPGRLAGVLLAAFGSHFRQLRLLPRVEDRPLACLFENVL